VGAGRIWGEAGIAMTWRFIGNAFGVVVAVLLVVLVAGWLFMNMDSGKSAGQTASVEAAPSTASGDANPIPRPFFDEQYLKAIGAAVPFSSRDSALSVGRRACGALDEGRSPAEVRQILTQKGFTDAQAGRIMLAAAMAYCPEHAKKVNG
jgi:hypothetical protein